MSIDKYIDFNPVKISPNTVLKNVVISLADDKVSCLLVVAAEKLVGILTQSDVVKLVATGTNLGTTTVEQVMTQPVCTIMRSQCQALSSVQSFFQQYAVSYLPIIKGDQELIGVIAACNFFKQIQADSIANNNEKQELARFFNLSTIKCIAGFDGYFKQVNAAFTNRYTSTRSISSGTPSTRQQFWSIQKTVS